MTLVSGQHNESYPYRALVLTYAILIIQSSGRKVLLLILAATNRSVTTIVISMVKITISMINLTPAALTVILTGTEDKRLSRLSNSS